MFFSARCLFTAIGIRESPLCVSKDEGFRAPGRRCTWKCCPRRVSKSIVPQKYPCRAFPPEDVVGAPPFKKHPKSLSKCFVKCFRSIRFRSRKGQPFPPISTHSGPDEQRSLVIRSTRNAAPSSNFLALLQKSCSCMI